MFNEDNLHLLSIIEDDHYDIAIVDPGYGIGEDWKKDSSSVFYKHKSTYRNESIPTEKYFSELFRISKNQIIFGGNYFTRYLPPTNYWIIWNKLRNVEKTFMSECEMAWTSFKVPARIVNFLWDGAKKCEKPFGKHPHEKPVMLYRWILQKYAKPGDKIIDTHGGSGSICIACDDLNYDLTWIEKDHVYFDDACRRLKIHRSQLKLNLQNE